MLILSANEGNIPKSVNDSSFIPHVIRRAYGLTTIENKIAIYAYYFHRMMQRATDVSITYNNSTNDTKTNEMSRFMMQLIAESDLKINIAEMTSSLLVGKTERCDVQKNKEVIEKMEAENTISPTAINAYLRCQLQYFYRFVCGINDNTESDEEEMDNRTFGLVFHKAAELIYRPYLGKSVTESMIDGMLKDPSVIERAIDEGFKEELFSLKDEEAKKRPMPTLDGTQLIHREIIRKMLRQLLEYDKKNCPITIVDVEKYIEDYITFDTDRGPRTLKIKGIIDRLDIVKNGDGHLEMRVVDYKTGSRTPGNVKSVSDIFTPEGANSNAHTDYYLQTLLYSRILAHPMQGTPQNGTYPVVPALLYPHRSQAENYDPVLKIDKERIADINAFTAEYNDGFIRVLKDIYDYSRPFAATQNADQCERCFYKNICGKNK
jgi:ATP-dependent helicase/DNAse subunit B